MLKIQTQIYIAIPSYKPDSKLLDLCIQIAQAGLAEKTLIVNDGSGLDYDPIFDEVKKMGIEVTCNEKNLGKGQALKKAFENLFQKSDCAAIVTADGDGQHSVPDILKLYTSAERQSSVLWLGARNFRQDNIPWRSSFGNKLTRKIFYLITRKDVEDTQTGLRSIPRNLIPLILNLKSKGFEFEQEVLLTAVKHSLEIKPIPISTIYISENKSSHFRPFLDSLKIYFVFLRYLSSSLCCAAIDYTLFFLTYGYFGIANAVLIGRFFSGILNFSLNRNLVFKSKGNFISDATKYLLLCVLNALISITFIQGLFYLTDNIFISKIFAETLLFFGNFIIQRILIFKRGLNVA